MRAPCRAKPTAVLTEQEVVEIVTELSKPDDRRMRHTEIAKKYGVSKKTISRISTGETWGDISQKMKLRDTPSQQVTLPENIFTPTVPEEFIDFLDEVTAVKNTFGFDFALPLHWGWFDSADGKHSVVTDGFICWESADLVAFAERLKQSEVNGTPVYADRAVELPTFEIAEIMEKPIGVKFYMEADCGGVVRLSSEDGDTVLLRSRYAAIAVKMKLEIRKAGAQTEYVYFTKAKSKVTADTASVVMACVATVCEKASDN